MEIGLLFHILRARIGVILLSMAIVLSTAIVIRIAFPGSYKAVASVIVDPRGINSVSGAATQESLAQDAVLGTYANIARSEGLARQVFDRLPISYRNTMKIQWLKSHVSEEDGFEAWAARRLMRAVDVRAGGQSSHVLDITVGQRDSSSAALVANTYAKTLIAYAQNMRILSAKKDADYFITQAQAMRGQTEEAERRLASFQRTHGITSADDRLDIEASKLAAISSQVIVNQDLSYESTLRARQSGDNSTEVINNGLVQSLSAEVARRETRFQELSARLGENHPDIRSARAQLEEAKASLARASRNVSASLGSSSATARARAAALKNDSEQQKQKVVELNAIRIEMTALDRDVMQKRKLYEAALQRSTEAGLEAGSQRSDLQVLTEAVAPEDTAGPGAAVVLPLATLAGLLVGMLLVILLDRLRPRIYRLADLEEIGIPVLEVIPVTPLPGTALQPKLLGLRR